MTRIYACFLRVFKGPLTCNFSSREGIPWCHFSHFSPIAAPQKLPRNVSFASDASLTLPPLAAEHTTLTRRALSVPSTPVAIADTPSTATAHHAHALSDSTPTLPLRAATMSAAGILEGSTRGDVLGLKRAATVGGSLGTPKNQEERGTSKNQSIVFRDYEDCRNRLTSAGGTWDLSNRRLNYTDVTYVSQCLSGVCPRCMLCQVTPQAWCPYLY